MKRILFILSIISLHIACNKPDAHFREELNAATKVYPGGIDSVTVFNGFGGFTLEVFLPPNGTATKIAFVKDGRDTVYYPIPKEVTAKTLWMQFANMPVGDASFQVFTLNEQGTTSPAKRSFRANVLDAGLQLSGFRAWRGNNRMRLDFVAPAGQALQKIALARAGKDTIFHELDPATSGLANQVMIENLEEGDQDFNLVLIAKDGSKSNGKAFSLNIYGENYRKALSSNAGFTSAQFSVSGWDYYIRFSDISSRAGVRSRLVRFGIYYGAKDVVVEIPLTAVAAWLANTYYPSDYATNTNGLFYAYRYLPENGIDVLQTDFVKATVSLI